MSLGERLSSSEGFTVLCPLERGCPPQRGSLYCVPWREVVLLRGVHCTVSLGERLFCVPWREVVLSSEGVTVLCFLQFNSLELPLLEGPKVDDEKDTVQSVDKTPTKQTSQVCGGYVEGIWPCS